MGFPFVHGDVAEDLAAVEAVVGESLCPVKVREVGHGLVGQRRQRRSLQGGGGVGADVAKVPLLVGKEFELSDACPYADEESDILAESSVSPDDIVVGFFAGVVAAESPVLESHSRERYAPVSWQNPDGTEVRRSGSSRSGHFVQWC